MRQRAARLITFRSFAYRLRRWRLSRVEPVSVLTRLLGIDQQTAREYQAEFQQIKAPAKQQGDWSADDQVVEAEYLLCRALQPELVIETGVNAGRSSMVILTALEKNAKGHLVSIDLPSERARCGWTSGQRETGWMVPDELRSRWDLRLGDARTLLPQALTEFGSPGIFIHDSDHSYDHMLWELQSAAEVMGTTGVLLADDLAPDGGAFSVFSEQRPGDAYRVGRLGVFRLEA